MGEHMLTVVIAILARSLVSCNTFRVSDSVSAAVLLHGSVLSLCFITFPIVGGTCIGQLPSRNTVKPVLAAL